MTPVEVITLASIVHKEKCKADERPIIARVYLNRLEQGNAFTGSIVIYSLK
jgi:UPF0755 protein